MLYGPGDTVALTLAGFSPGMDGHDRVAAALSSLRRGRRRPRY